MARLTLDSAGNGFLLRTTYAERMAAKEAGGRWDPRQRVWRFPLDLDVAELAKSLRLELDESAKQLIQSRERKRKAMASLHLADDAIIRFRDHIDPYQRVGVRFLADAGRAILADEPGLGKTAQAIRACDEVGAERVLVVTKKSLIHQWHREIARFACLPWAYKVLNYEQAVKRIEELEKDKIDVLIVDEATRIKNRKAQRTKAVHRLAKVARYVWLLTGTPIHNHPEELWSLLHALDPEVYSSYWRWVDKHCYLVQTPWAIEVGEVKNPERLQEELAPLMLRRSKSLLGLPPKSRETITVELPDRQMSLYQQMKHAMVAVLSEGKILSAPTVLAQLTRLRQIALDPGLIGATAPSAKTEAVIDICEDFAGHKILVFTSFAQYAIRLADALQSKGVRPVVYHGQMSAKERDEAVRLFQEDKDYQVLIGTIDAMGEGLNLTAADIVVFADKSWVPAMNEQAEDRAHRRGQEKPVHVISIVADRTVDKYLEEVLEKKVEMSKEVEVAVAVIKLMLSEEGLACVEV